MARLARVAAGAFARAAAVAVALALAGGGTGARAQPVDPLLLAPEPAPVEATTPLGLRLELWRQQFERRAGAAGAAFQHRAVADLRREWRAGAWKLGLSDRLDLVRAPGDEELRHALRELYASRAFEGDGGSGFLDAGRINWRNGVGVGFNPTDFLRRDAVIEQGSQDPVALRENRVGVVMLRGQWVGAFGSAQLGLIPDLAGDPAGTGGGLAPAWNRSNARRALVWKLAPRTGQRLSWEALGSARAGEQPRFGTNLTLLIDDGLLAFAEVAGGVARPLAGPDEAPAPASWTSASSLGLSWTSPAGITVTLEHDRAGDALDRERWDAWRRLIGTPRESELGALRAEQGRRQSPLVRRSWFGRVAWTDAFRRRDLELAALVRINAFDRSALWQAELAWHADARNTLRLLAGGFGGAAQTEYGSVGTRRHGTIAWARYL